jgi:hypothetical protein
MKTVKTLIAFLWLVVLCSMVSCSDHEESVPEPPAPEPPSITIPSTENLHPSFTSGGGKDTLIFIATADWNATIKADNKSAGWLTVFPPSGSKGEHQLIIAAAGNLTPDDRDAEVILQCGEVVKTITVHQDFNYQLTLLEDGEVTTLQEHTKGKGINLVIMGDGFVTMDMGRGGKYETLMKKTVEAYFSVEPMCSLREYFNVYSVTVISASDVIGENTALSTTFTGGTSITGNNNKCMEYARKVNQLSGTVRNTPMIVVLNSPRYAGTTYMHSWGYSIAFCPYVENNDERFAQIIHHEAVGHGFGYLGDEYDNEHEEPLPLGQANDLQKAASMYGWYSNLDFTPDIEKVKWHRFISDARYAAEGLGAWEGAYGYKKGVYRPTEISIMRYNVGGFNAPAREAIYKRVMQLAGEAYSYDRFIEYDAINRTDVGRGVKHAEQKGIDKTHFIPLASPRIIL